MEVIQTKTEKGHQKPMKKWLVNFEKVRLGHNRVGIAWGRGFKSTIKHGSHFLWVNEGVN